MVGKQSCHGRADGCAAMHCPVRGETGDVLLVVSFICDGKERPASKAKEPLHHTDAFTVAGPPRAGLGAVSARGADARWIGAPCLWRWGGLRFYDVVVDGSPGGRDPAA